MSCTHNLPIISKNSKQTVIALLFAPRCQLIVCLPGNLDDRVSVVGAEGVGADGKDRHVVCLQPGHKVITWKYVS